MTTKQIADVTAIIPVYNGKKFLLEAVQSVLSQTLLPKQLIIVDDGSTDGSMGVLDHLDSPIPIVKVSQANAGQAAARNKGINLADTTFIALLDQDDYWFPRHIEVLINPLAADPAIGWAYSDLDLIATDGKTTHHNLLSLMPMTHPKALLNVCLAEDMYILPSASMIRKEAFDSIQGFDERLSGYEDDDLFLRLFCRGWKNVYIPEPLSAWRMHTGSSMHSNRMISSRRIYAEKLFREYPDRPELGQYYTRDCIAPRFYLYNESDYWRGVRDKDSVVCENARKSMEEYARLFDKSLRVKLRLFLMKYPLVMTQVDRLYKFVAARVQNRPADQATPAQGRA